MSGCITGGKMNTTRDEEYPDKNWNKEIGANDAIYGIFLKLIYIYCKLTGKELSAQKQERKRK